MKRKIVITCTLVACLCLMSLSSLAAAEKQAQAGKTDQKAAVTKVTDPVCHMEVDPAKTKETATYKNKTYHFCSSYCKNQFEKDPGKYSK
jgi:YHS domain-containing protein